MHKKLKHLIKNLKDVFDIDEIHKIVKETKFVQRKSNITAFDTQISKQALDKRFNKHSVEFMREIFNQMMHSQNTTLKSLNDTLNLHFNRVIINDSTSFSLPKEFKKEFAGSGGVISPSSIVFTAKNIIMEDDDKEISEIKSFGALAQYLPKLAHEIFKGELCIIRILKRIIANFKRLGIKSRKKHKKTVFDVLQILKLKPYEIEKIAI